MWDVVPHSSRAAPRCSSPALAPAAVRSADGPARRLTALESGVLAAAERRPRAATACGRSSSAPRLTAAARQHTFEMLADGYFEHESPTARRSGSGSRSSIRRAGYGYWSVGENLLWSSPASIRGERARALDGQPRAPQNILSPRWREIGIAAVHSSTSTGAYGGARGHGHHHRLRRPVAGRAATLRGRAPVAQWKSGGLLSRWSEVRILPGALYTAVRASASVPARP